MVLCFLGWSSKSYMVKEKYEKMIEANRNFKSTNLSVNLGSFENTIPQT